LKTLRTYLGRVVRDIARKIEGNASLRENAVLGESVSAHAGAGATGA
jgi:hypothetical protein